MLSLPAARSSKAPSERGARILGAIAIGAGVLHFTHTKVYESIMPDYVPAHTELVLASGAAEIAGGVGVLHPATRKVAGWWLVATLVAVFPANLHMALNPERYDALPPAALWARLPLQALFIFAALKVTGAGRRR